MYPARTFIPLGDPVAISGSSASTGAQISAGGEIANGQGAVRVYNAGPNTAHVKLWQTAGNTGLATHMKIPSGVVELIGVPAGWAAVHATVICAATETAAVQLTPGVGI